MKNANPVQKVVTDLIIKIVIVRPDIMMMAIKYVKHVNINVQHVKMVPNVLHAKKAELNHQLVDAQTDNMIMDKNVLFVLKNAKNVKIMNTNVQNAQMTEMLKSLNAHVLIIHMNQMEIVMNVAINVKHVLKMQKHVLFVQEPIE